MKRAPTTTALQARSCYAHKSPAARREAKRQAQARYEARRRERGLHAQTVRPHPTVAARLDALAARYGCTWTDVVEALVLGGEPVLQAMALHGFSAIEARDWVEVQRCDA